MYEDRPEKDTPQAICDDLAEYGGLSPDGQPIWRVVWAANCRIHCYGPMNHISTDIESLPDDARPTDVNPDRIEDGDHWIPRYDAEGWILQRWFPYLIWGTRQQWEGERAKDGRTRLLAAYPQNGDYMLMAGPWPTLEMAGDLHAAIRCYNAQQRNNPVNFENHMKAQLAFDAQRRQEKADAYADEIAAQHRLGFSSVIRSVSTAAQRFRNNLSKHSVGGLHLGASEKYG